MTTCKDCIHYKICRIVYRNGDDRVLENSPCANYKDKADVAEVKHGYNKTSMHPVDEFWCSECGFCCADHTETKYDEDGDYTYSCECEFDFCPHCGAKMDKENTQ